MTRPLDPQPLIRPSKLAHVVLRARDLERSIRWYRVVLGMEPIFRSEVVAFLTCDAEHHRIALVASGATRPAPTDTAGLDHFAFGYDSLGDLLRTYRRLRGEGIRPVWSINHGPTTSIYYADPDENRVELEVENFDSESELKAFMESPAFRRNPIGVQFDPDTLADRYERGHPLAELRRQGAA